MQTFLEVKKTLSFKVLFIFVIVTAASAVILAYLESGSGSSDWKTDLEQRVVNAQKWIDEVGKDDEMNEEDKVVLIDKERELISIWKFHIDNNIPNTPSVASFIYDMYSLNAILILFSIYLASKMLSLEYRFKTLEPLLLRPQSKMKVISAKLSALITSITMLQILFSCLSGIIGVIAFSSNGFAGSIVYNTEHEIVSASILPSIMFASGLAFAVNVTYAIMIFMLSTFITNQAGLVIIGIAYYVAGGILLDLVNTALPYEHLLLNHNLQYLDQQIIQNPIWNIELRTNFLSIVVHDVLFILITYLSFHRGALGLLQRIKKGA